MAIVNDGGGGGTSGGMGGGSTSNVCYPTPSDLVNSFGNLISRITQLETIVAQLLSSNIYVNQLSEISGDIGMVFSGTLGPATIINTTQDHAMVAFGLSLGNIQVEGNISVVTSEGGSITNMVTPSFWHAVFQVSKDGVYLVTGIGTYGNSQLQVPNGYSATVTMRAGSTPGGSDKGAFRTGDIMHLATGIQNSSTIVDFGQEYPNLTIGSVGTNGVTTFRLEAGDYIEVFIVPDSANPLFLDPPSVLNDTLNLTSMNITAVRLSGL